METLALAAVTLFVLWTLWKAAKLTLELAVAVIVIAALVDYREVIPVIKKLLLMVFGAG